MAPRSSWKGFLKLSLVSVPVRAYTANATGNDIRLNQLHKETHARIQYRKVVPDVGEVTADEIVKGYEYAKGQYVVIDDDELDKLRTESDKSITIDGFIQPDAVSYASPDNKKEVGLEIHSGKNRVVRRMFESLGYRVGKLDRVYFAGLTKKDLPRGKWRFLNSREISRLKMNAYE